MGSDLSMSPPAPPVWRLVRKRTVGCTYVAVYKRAVDRISGDDAVDNWHRVYLFDDSDDDHGWGALNFAFHNLAYGRFKEIDGDHIPAADRHEPLPEKLPKDALEDDNPLRLEEQRLQRELFAVREKIKRGERE